MSPSEKKTALMIYKAQIERNLSQLQVMLLEHNDILPEAISGPVYNLAEDYIKSIEKTYELSKKYRLEIIKILRELN